MPLERRLSNSQPVVPGDAEDSGKAFGHHAPLRISPLFNDMFLRIFGSEDSAPVALPLVNAILEAVGIPPLERIDEISADSSIPGGAVLKSPRLDVILRGDGRVVDLESQLHKTDVPLRMFYYGCNLVCSSVRKGARGYLHMPQVIVITLIDGFRLHDDDQVIGVSSFMSERGGTVERTFDRLYLVTVELEKVRERYNKLAHDMPSSALEAWLYVLCEGYRNSEKVEQIMDEFPDIEEFARLYDIALDDPNLRHHYDAWVEDQWMTNLRFEYVERVAREKGMKQGLEQGIEQGIEQGLEQGRIELADRLRSLGVDESILQEALAMG